MNYLIVSETRQTCEGCGGGVEPGIVGMTDEVAVNQRVVAQCRTCLAGLDQLLSAAWHSIHGFGRLADLRHVSEIFGLGNLDKEIETRHEERLRQIEADHERAAEVLESRAEEDMAASTAQRDRERDGARGNPETGPMASQICQSSKTVR